LNNINTDYLSFKKKMKQLKITQVDFAKFLGIDYSSIYKWKNKGYVPRYAIIVLKCIENSKKDMEFLKEFKICSKK